MNHDLIVQGANTITMFCRLNLNIKKDLPIRSSEMGLLIFITKSGGNLTSNSAASFFKVSKPMIAVMVAKLSKKGYIYKIQSKTDKRAYYLEPTDKARQLVDEAYDEYTKVMDLLISKMGQDKYTQLISLLKEANEIISDKENENG